MSDIETPKHKQFQFGLRKVLLWMAAVALGCGLLSALRPDALDWFVFSIWFAVVSILRLGFGSKVAAAGSVIAGMLLLAFSYSLVWAADNGWPELGRVLAVAAGSGIVGGVMGVIPFVLVEAAHRTIDWIDGLERSDE